MDITLGVNLTELTQSNGLILPQRLLIACKLATLRTWKYREDVDTSQLCTLTWLLIQYLPRKIQLRWLFLLPPLVYMTLGLFISLTCASIDHSHNQLCLAFVYGSRSGTILFFGLHHRVVKDCFRILHHSVL